MNGFVHAGVNHYQAKKMLTKLEAQRLAEKTLGIGTEQEVILSKTKGQQLELQILEEKTLEFEFGWVFFYQSKKFIETGNLLFALGGNAPLIVDKYIKEIFRTGTAYPIEKYLDDYLIKHYNGLRGWKIVDSSTSSEKVKWIKILKTSLELNSTEALNFYNERSKKVFSTPEKLKLLQKELKQVGVDIEIKKHWIKKPQSN